MKKNFENLLGNAISGIVSDEQTIRQSIVIREDFKSLIPSLNDDELDQLESNIIKDGVRDPLIIWPFNSQLVLIDGHNRFSICQKHGISFPFKEMRFADEDEAKDWMIKNQLGRRNATPDQISYLRGLRYNREKSQGKRSDLTLDQSDPKSQLSTAGYLAKEYNVGEATIKRDGEFAKGVELIGEHDPMLKDKILKGESELSKKEIIQIGKEKSGNRNPSARNPTEKITVKELASIAFDYAANEKRSIQDVCTMLEIDYDEVTPIQYFIRWNESKKF